MDRLEKLELRVGILEEALNALLNHHLNHASTVGWEIQSIINKAVQEASSIKEENHDSRN